MYPAADCADINQTAELLWHSIGPPTVWISLPSAPVTARCGPMAADENLSLRTVMNTILAPTTNVATDLIIYLITLITVPREGNGVACSGSEAMRRATRAGRDATRRQATQTCSKTVSSCRAAAETDRRHRSCKTS